MNFKSRVFCQNEKVMMLLPALHPQTRRSEGVGCGGGVGTALSALLPGKRVPVCARGGRDSGSHGFLVAEQMSQACDSSSSVPGVMALPSLSLALAASLATR